MGLVFLAIPNVDICCGASCSLGRGMPTFFHRGRHLRRKEQVHRTLPGSAYRIPAGLDLRESTRHTSSWASSWAATRAYGSLRRGNVRVALPWVGLRNDLRSLAWDVAARCWAAVTASYSAGLLRLPTTVGDPECAKGSTYQPFNKQLSSKSPCSLTRRAKLSHTPRT